jgi:hypothetical protein
MKKSLTLQAVEQLKIPLPLEGERSGEGVKYQSLTPSPPTLSLKGEGDV